MNTLDRKKRHFEILKKRIAANKRGDAVAKHQISILQKKARTKKLIYAGLIFEEAGILDTYEHDVVLNALKSLKNERCV